MLKEMINNLTNKELLAYLEGMHPHDIAKEFSELSLEEQERIASLLDTETFSEVMTYLDPSDAAEYLSDLDLKEQVNIINYMDPDDATDIILEYDSVEQKEIIDELEDKEDIKKLILYDENQAGAYMTSSFISLHPELNVKQATKILIKEAPNVESINTLFVVDHHNKYLGTLSFKTLVASKMPLSVSDILTKTPAYYDLDHIDEVVQGIRHYGGYEVPIINSNEELLGVITIDDVLDIYEEQSQEDYEKLSALPQSDTKNPLFSAFLRLPWLIILLILSLPIAFVTSLFEEVLASVVLLAMFEPLILDAGGDVATQTLAVTLITLNNKEGRPFKNGVKEIITGFINGIVLGVLAFIATIIVAKMIDSNHVLALALVVSVSLWLTVFLGPIIGFLVPVSLKKLKIDPAIASGPFITTLIDIFSLLIYLGLSTLLLGGVINV